MKNHVLSIAASVALLLSASQQGTAHGSVVVDRVVAIVNDEIITMSDLQREESLRKTNGKVDERLLLEDMIDRTLQMAAAKRSGMDVTDKELADALSDIMKRNSLDAGQFEAALIKDGLTLDQWVECERWVRPPYLLRHRGGQTGGWGERSGADGWGPCRAAAQREGGAALRVGRLVAPLPPPSPLIAPRPLSAPSLRRGSEWPLLPRGRQ